MYVSKIQELEGELLLLKNLSSSKRNQFVDYLDSDDERFRSKDALLQSLNELSSNSDTKAADISGNV
jgi:kinesin family protein 4/21/27